MFPHARIAACLAAVSTGELLRLCFWLALVWQLDEGQVLLEAGQPWPYVVFILRGSISYDAWGYVVESTCTDADGTVVQQLRMVGTVALFGSSLLSDTSRVRMATAGTLAGLTFEQVHEMSAANRRLGLNLLFLFGQSAVRQAKNIEQSQNAERERPEAPYMFSIAFEETGAVGSRVTLFDALEVRAATHARRRGRCKTAHTRSHTDAS
jgi:hypothetical protein